MVFLIRGGNPEIVSFLRAGPENVLWRVRAAAPDALAVLPGVRGTPPVTVHTAVVPLDSAVTAKQIISYGLEQNCTVTLSSHTPEGCMLALRRDIVTLGGTHIERQEIALPPLTDPEQRLGICGTLLAAGCPPESLFERMQGLQES